MIDVLSDFFTSAIELVAKGLGGFLGAIANLLKG